MKPLSIYVASSWRNDRQPALVQALRGAQFEVYDFRDPAFGFSWRDIDPAWRTWSAARYLQALESEPVIVGYERDMAALEDADCVILVLPCGKSAHLEAGWAVGQGKPLIIVLDSREIEPDLMYRMAAKIVTTLEDAVAWAFVIQAERDDNGGPA